MEPENKGKTLWEMLTERLHSSGNGAGIAFANPLDLRVGSALAVAYADGPEFAGHDFTVQEIREYDRRIQGQDVGLKRDFINDFDYFRNLLTGAIYFAHGEDHSIQRQVGFGELLH